MYLVKSTLFLSQIILKHLLYLSHCKSPLVHDFDNVLSLGFFRIQGSFSDDNTDLWRFFDLVELH